MTSNPVRGSSREEAPVCCAVAAGAGRRGRRGRLRLRLLLGGLRLLLGGRRRLRLGLGLRLTRERVGVLLVARAVLRARRGGGQGDREG
jgi:hypothetical protein